MSFRSHNVFESHEWALIEKRLRLFTSYSGIMHVYQRSACHRRASLWTSCMSWWLHLRAAKPSLTHNPGFCTKDGSQFHVYPETIGFATALVKICHSQLVTILRFDLWCASEETLWPLHERHGLAWKPRVTRKAAVGTVGSGLHENGIKLSVYEDLPNRRSILSLYKRRWHKLQQGTYPIQYTFHLSFCTTLCPRK